VLGTFGNRTGTFSSLSPADAFVANYTPTQFLVRATGSFPVADAGTDITVDEATPPQVVVLDGTGSFDPDGTIVSYSWTAPAGIVLGTPNSAQATFVAADDADFNAILEVCDNDGLCSADSVSITVNNVAPSVEAGPALSTVVGAAVTATVSFTDPGGIDTHTATVNWDDGAGLIAMGTVSSPFDATRTYGSAGTYTANVCVTDDDGGTGCDTVTIVVNPNPNADLVATKSTIAHGHVGVSQAFVVSLENLGPAVATNATLTDTLPAGLVFDAGDPTGEVSDGGLCDVVDQTVTCTWSEVSAGGERTAELNVVPTAANPTVTNTVVAASDAPDPDLSNNTGTSTSKVSEAPTVSVSFSDPAMASGEAAHFVSIDIEANDPDGDPLVYTIQWGDGTSTSGAYVPGGVTRSRTYTTPGVYAAVVQVTDGGPTVPSTSLNVNVAVPQPLVAVTGGPYSTVVGGASPITLDASASTPQAGITGYLWQLSDGRSFTTKVVPNLTFSTPGTITAILTVSRNAETAQQATTITVLAEPLDTLQVTITDAANGLAIPGAEVTVIDADGVRFSAQSDGVGHRRTRRPPRWRVHGLRREERIPTE
jgi:hypothetical protein